MLLTTHYSTWQNYNNMKLSFFINDNNLTGMNLFKSRNKMHHLQDNISISFKAISRGSSGTYKVRQLVSTCRWNRRDPASICLYMVSGCDGRTGRQTNRPTTKNTGKINTSLDRGKIRWSTSKWMHCTTSYLKSTHPLTTKFCVSRYFVERVISTSWHYIKFGDFAIRE